MQVVTVDQYTFHLSDELFEKFEACLAGLEVQLDHREKIDDRLCLELLACCEDTDGTPDLYKRRQLIKWLFVWHLMSPSTAPGLAAGFMKSEMMKVGEYAQAAGKLRKQVDGERHERFTGQAKPKSRR